MGLTGMKFIFLAHFCYEQTFVDKPKANPFVF
jgi:hypothetical protein